MKSRLTDIGWPKFIAFVTLWAAVFLSLPMVATAIEIKNWNRLGAVLCVLVLILCAGLLVLAVALAKARDWARKAATLLFVALSVLYFSFVVVAFYRSIRTVTPPGIVAMVGLSGGLAFFSLFLMNPRVALEFGTKTVPIELPEKRGQGHSPEPVFATVTPRTWLTSLRFCTYAIMLICILVAHRLGYIPVTLTGPPINPRPLDADYYIGGYAPAVGVGFQNTWLSGAELFREARSVARKEGVDLAHYHDPQLSLQPVEGIMRWYLTYEPRDEKSEYRVIRIFIDDRSRKSGVERLRRK